MAKHVLYVHAQNETVGELSFESSQDSYDFAYSDSWLKQDSAFPLSTHIPLFGEGIRPGAVQRFLQNLLPEGRALDVVSMTHQISKGNVFGLIALLGNEPAGALSFTREPVDPASSQVLQPTRRLIDPTELSRRIQERDHVPFPIWDGKVRLSVAGYQDKLQVLVEGEQMSLAEGSLASSHILKPDSRSLVTPCMVANEHFCMTLAGQLGLNVARVELRRIPEPILLIERFDRHLEKHPSDNTTITRVMRHHVIDGCQALDLPVSFKYERNFGHGRDVRHIREGVSHEKLFALENFSNPLAARMSLLRWALMQILLGNSDAHGKNISFYVRGSYIEPAPFYDLVSVNVYGDAVEQDMAMAYGDVFLLDELTPFDLADFTRRIGMPPKVVSREMTRLAKQAKTLAPNLAKSSIYDEKELRLLQAITALVLKQADKLMEFAPQLPKVDPTLL